MLIFSGTTNPQLASELAETLGLNLSPAEISRFKDGECHVEIKTQVAKQNILIIQAISGRSEQSLLELCLFAHALRQRGANSITALIPYLAYARSQANLKLIVAMLATAGIDHIVSIDLHDESALSELGIKVTNISTAELFAANIASNSYDIPLIISPDQGGAKRAGRIANILNAKLLIGQKSRCPITGNVNIRIHDVSAGKRCIIVDDIVDTAKTLYSMAQLLHGLGVTNVEAYCTHGVLSNGSIRLLAASGCIRIHVTNSLILNNQARQSKILRQIALQKFIAKKLINNHICF
jgi:ribose-phosphate pyrophosphokinase